MFSDMFFFAIILSAIGLIILRIVYVELRKTKEEEREEIIKKLKR